MTHGYSVFILVIKVSAEIIIQNHIEEASTPEYCPEYNLYKFEDRNKNISVKFIILRLCIVQSLNVFAVVDVKKLNFEFMWKYSTFQKSCNINELIELVYVCLHLILLIAWIRSFELLDLKYSTIMLWIISEKPWKEFLNS